MVTSLIVAGLVVAFYTGRMVERVQWNGLITKGILPRPRVSR